MFGESCVEDRMAVWLCGAVLYGCWEGGEEVCGLVEEGFGALGYEGWWGGGGVGENGG